MHRYCMYLRKSRADLEAEQNGEGETLARHEQALTSLSEKMEIPIDRIYREIISGESIAARPVMQELLSDVEQGVWDGVLVMEIERLARGDTMDQGIVAQTFKFSSTKIITPLKTYDPTNEFDEEYFEFGLFMSRREYKTINRRLQRGRIASVKEGKFCGSTPPYGYEKIKLDKEKGYTLSPIPDQAEIVKLIFELYTEGELKEDGTRVQIGTSLIAKKLNSMKIPSPKGGLWSQHTLRDFLNNPVYMGKIRWYWRGEKQKMKDGKVKRTRSRNTNDECLIVDGLHPPIISEEVFNKAHEIMTKNPAPPVKRQLKNPLAGVLVCGKCGHNMIRRPYPDGYPDTIMCQTNYCDNVSSSLEVVERKLLESIAQWVRQYELELASGKINQSTSQVDANKKAIKKINTNIENLNKQLDNLHDLLEQGVYTVDIFKERYKILTDKIETEKNNKDKIKKLIKKQEYEINNRKIIIPQAKELLKVYYNLPSVRAKNDMLKRVVRKVTYTKLVNGRWHNSPDDFGLTIYPNIPPQNENE